MRLYLSSLALLVLVDVADVASGNYFALLLRNASSRPDADQFGTTNRMTYNAKPGGRSGKTLLNGFTTTWTRILQYPPESVEVAVGSRVELYCEVAGNPPPQVYWITGNESEKQIQELLAQAEKMSDSVAGEWEGVSRVGSTYVIDCVKPEDQGLKYCMSVSKNIVKMAVTALLVNSTKVVECAKESQPTITLHHFWRFALSGTTVILPCRVVGQPTPYLFWIDRTDNRNHKIISPATHTRHTVLPSGDLQIMDINWSDFGEYTCKVQSGYTEKSADTFLYPIRRNEDEKEQL